MTTTIAVAAPAKIIIERRALPGAEAALKRWAERFVEYAQDWPGHDGSSVLAAGRGAYFVLCRFESQHALNNWQRSSAYAELIREADSLSTASERQQVQTGFGTWFALPDMPAP